MFDLMKPRCFDQFGRTVALCDAFFGFVFFFVGRSMGKEDKTVKILGILDIFATISVIAIYIIAFMALAM